MEPIELREFRNRIGKAIRRLREEEGISALYLSKVLGVTQPTVSRIENGAASIQAEKLCFLARTFNRPLQFFIGEQSPIIYDENDILRAGLVYYGAHHLKSKRTINVREHFKSYADFLNSALNFVDDTRFAAALATTLYYQAAKSKLETTRILTTVQNKRLVGNLQTLLVLVRDSDFYIKRPEKEKKQAIQQINNLCAELDKEHGHEIERSLVAEISEDYVAKFINASLNADEN